MAPCSGGRRRGSRRVFLLAAAASCLPTCAARSTEYVPSTDGGPGAAPRQLAVDRVPALYTREFGDCLGHGNGNGSMLSATRFDAALYRDNGTVVFHLHANATSAVEREEAVLLYISLDAYGQSRYAKSLDPCAANITSLCPLKPSAADKSVRAWAALAMTAAQIAEFPPMAFSMPDLDGLARIQIFGNSTRREYACFQAHLTNGVSLSQPEIVVPVLGAALLGATVASFLAAAYGVSLPHMRMHYAHSLPVLLVLEAYQTVFFSGALSVDWPAILPAWWSNFAWSAGLIQAPALVRAVDSFAGAAEGRAGAVAGGGYEAAVRRPSVADVYGATTRRLVRRRPFNETNPYDYTWARDTVSPGMPFPGTQRGFPAALAALNIPAADAFTVGLVWFLVALATVALLVPALKLCLEGLAWMRFIKEDRLGYFRNHYLGYTGHAALRVMFASFFMLTTLCTFQFALGGAPASPAALAAVVLACLVIGLGIAVVLACYSRVRPGKIVVERDSIGFRSVKLFDTIPCLAPARLSTLQRLGEEERWPTRPLAGLSLPAFRVRHVGADADRPTVHKDEPYIKTYGWLAARYRRRRWWFFACYLAYQLGRAAFLGGGAQNPPAQVYGLLAYEIVAFAAVAGLRPFEGARNTALAAWMLGIAKVLATGLSVAFLPGLALARDSALTVGIVIITVQGLLVAAVLVLTVLSVLSSWMSLSRNRAEFNPEALDLVRPYYFADIQAKAEDKPSGGRNRPATTGITTRAESKIPQKQTSDSESSPSSSSNGGGVRPERAFSVTSVRRNPKIGDEEDNDIVTAMERPGVVGRPNRAASIVSARLSSSSLQHQMHPQGQGQGQQRGPRRTSWGSHEIPLWDASMTSLEKQQQQQQQSRQSSTLSKQLADNGGPGDRGVAGVVLHVPSPLAADVDGDDAASPLPPVSPPYVTPPSSPGPQQPGSPVAEPMSLKPKPHAPDVENR